MSYQFNVRCDLCLWNAESKTVVENCLLVLRTAWRSQMCWRRIDTYIQTHINTHTHKDTPMHTLTHSHANTHRHTHTHTHRKRHMQAYTYTYTHTSTHGLMHTNMYTHRHTTHTHTTCQQTLIITQQKSLRQCHNCVTVFSVDWLQEQEEVLKVKYLLQSWKRSKQTKYKRPKSSPQQPHCLWRPKPVI